MVSNEIDLCPPEPVVKDVPGLLVGTRTRELGCGHLPSSEGAAPSSRLLLGLPPLPRSPVVMACRLPAARQYRSPPVRSSTRSELSDTVPEQPYAPGKLMWKEKQRLIAEEDRNLVPDRAHPSLSIGCT